MIITTTSTTRLELVLNDNWHCDHSSDSFRNVKERQCNNVVVIVDPVKKKLLCLINSLILC